ncbi:membrane protein, major facilitator superfamily [Syntrophotalea carbinolica DSM 2380]|uniref:Membrane protein, major facilitator superfamily n=1 Tax=Syntrophotalea carbinolica (strain DSM 2380 / NBRC 103641 / GraBd1) TaxID=338963 RepID=Q3A1Q0_SYNC1|nr:membrane protein, major facilitator superfamily [Syntrophotalea carbinolica DSM 2380]
MVCFSSQLYSRAFWAMSLANFSTAASFGVFFLFPLFIEARGGSEADIGIIMGVFGLAATLCRPWVSGLVDRIGRRRSFTVGSLMMVGLPVGYMLLSGPLAGFYPGLMLLRILHGVGMALCFTAAFTFVADIVPPERLNEGIGIFGISGLVGMAVGPALAEFALHRYGFFAMFVVASLLAGVGLVAHLPLSEPVIERQARDVDTSFLDVLKRPKITTVALLAILFGLGQASTGNFVAPLAAARQVVHVSLFFVAYSVAAALVRIGGGRLADRVGELRVIPYALVITGGGLLALSVAYQAWSLTLAGAVTGCGHGLLFPSLNSLAVRDEPGGIRGKITGIYTGALDGGNFCGSILLGYIGEWLGLQILFMVAGLALFSGLVVLPWGLRRQAP